MKLSIIPIHPQFQSQAHRTKRMINHLNLQKRTVMEIIQAKESTLVVGRKKFKIIEVAVA
jgi:hypothetical protein